ncbi:MAG: caspase family protein [Holophagales bacterium]|nr:caspase family protein [Holophagales bacterium]
MHFTRLRNIANARILTGATTLTVMVLSLFWWRSEPREFEPAIAAVTSVSAFIVAFRFAFLSFDKNMTSDRIALIVGNSEYPFSHLPNVKNDVEAVQASLSSKGFRIIKAVNLPRPDLVKAIYDFQTILSTGGVGLLYYAGHAGQIDGDDLILPVDADPDTREDYLEAAININDLLGPVDKIIEDSPAHNGSVIIYSTASGSMAMDGNENFRENSPFASCFLKLADQWNLEIFDLFRRLCRRMQNATEGLQVPWLAASLDVEFYFKPIVKEEIGVLKILVFDACRNNPFMGTSRAHVFRVVETQSVGQEAARR